MYSNRWVELCNAIMETEIFCYRYSTVNISATEQYFKIKFGSLFRNLLGIDWTKIYSDIFRFDIFIARRLGFLPDTVCRCELTITTCWYGNVLTCYQLRRVNCIYCCIISQLICELIRLNWHFCHFTFPPVAWQLSVPSPSNLASPKSVIFTWRELCTATDNVRQL